MAKTRLSNAVFVERGYGQVEPNHLSAQRNGQIYAQLPAAADINFLENGQFVKYNYAKGVVDFGASGENNAETKTGEWMLVFNEVKLYRDGQDYNDFAMKKEDYDAIVYSPIDGNNPQQANSRNYQGIVSSADPYEVDSTENPFVIEQFTRPAYMPQNTKMVPRVFKTMPGDIFTTNTVNVADINLAVGDLLYVGDNGYLTKTKKQSQTATGDASGDMTWQVVKKYTLPDRQKAVKIMRIA